MTLSIRQKALFGWAAVLFGTTGISIAQEPGIMTVPAPPCTPDGICADRQISIATAGAPPSGLGQVGVITTRGMAVALQEDAELVKNQPYAAQAVTEVKQTLADGSHITQTTTATVARDSSGRTVRIQQLSTIGPWKSSSDSLQTNPTLTTIFDPVANTHTDYTSDNKVAHVLPMPPLPPGALAYRASGFADSAPGPAGSDTGPVTFSVRGHDDTPQLGEIPDVKTEPLGAKTIEGISATGTKTTTIIPAGAIGNDKDLAITRETWYSSDLKLVLQSTQADPRFGETSYSLTNIQRNEPDSTLFEVPAGYKVEKGMVIVRSN